MNKQKPSQDSSEEIQQEEAVADDLSRIIHPNLLKEIREFTTIKPSSEHSEDPKVVMVLFLMDKENNCMVSIFPSYYYDLIDINNNSIFNGYLILDDKMVSFFYDEECVHSWINTDMLIKTRPDNYPDNKSGYGDIIHDPTEKRFKVNNDDMTLELIYKGILGGSN